MKSFKEKFNNLLTNYELKSFLTSTFSFFINIAFLVYNLIFGIIYKSIWNWSISIYYTLLIVFRAIILFKEKNWNKQKTDNLDYERLKFFKIICWCSIFIDLSLIAPITLMVLSKRAVNIGMIPTIAVAAYTTYKVTLSIINYVKKKSNENLSIKALRLITLKDAIVSILTLQNTMVMTFGESSSMLTLTAISSAGMLLILIAITIGAIFKAYKNTI